MDEYLHALQERHTMKAGGKSILPTLGDIVLLKDDVKDRAKWRIARIIKELKGSDHQLRGYELKLGNGYTIRRPIQLVCPLEIKSDINETNAEDTCGDITNETIPQRPQRRAKDDAKAKISVLSEEN